MGCTPDNTRVFGFTPPAAEGAESAVGATADMCKEEAAGANSRDADPILLVDAVKKLLATFDERIIAAALSMQVIGRIEQRASSNSRLTRFRLSLQRQVRGREQFFWREPKNHGARN